MDKMSTRSCTISGVPTPKQPHKRNDIAGKNPDNLAGLFIADEWQRATNFD